MDPVDTQMIDRAFHEIYDATYSRTAAYLTARCRQLSDVDDLLQETYLAIYRVLTAQGRSALENPEAYVISVAKTKIIDWYRKAKPDDTNLATVPPAEDDTWLNRLPTRRPRREETYQDSRNHAGAGADCSKAGRHTRQAFYLHYALAFLSRNRPAAKPKRIHLPAAFSAPSRKSAPY